MFKAKLLQYNTEIKLDVVKPCSSSHCHTEYVPDLWVFFLVLADMSLLTENCSYIDISICLDLFLIPLSKSTLQKL